MTTQATIDAAAPEESPKAPSEALAPAPLGDLLDQLCRIFDIKLAPNQLASVLNESCGEVDHEWSWRLVNALEGIGLSGALLELDALDAYQTSKRSEGALITRITSVGKLTSRAIPTGTARTSPSTMGKTVVRRA